MKLPSKRLVTGRCQGQMLAYHEFSVSSC